MVEGPNPGAALVGGANLVLLPSTTAMFQRAGMLSPEGRCKTLDAAADGYVRAEAVGVMLLCALGGAGATSGRSPLALIAGSAVNQDGRSSSLTAPNGPAQQEVMRQALASAGAGPADVAALQMHGTGTPLGDPIEVGAAAEVLLGPASRQPLAFLASKSAVGHAEPAAGEGAVSLGGACLALLPKLLLLPASCFVRRCLCVSQLHPCCLSGDAFA